jgi:hypothetical protein
MGRTGSASEVSIATFLFAVLALNPPVLSIFSVEVFLFGIPLLYLYLFAVWLIIVMLVAWIAIGGGRGSPKGEAADDAGQSARDRRRSKHAR